MASTLVELLGQDPVRPNVVTDCVTVIDAQVKTKGLFVKTAYGTVKALKKRFVADTVDALLNEWLGKLQPHYEKWQATKTTPTFSDYVIARSADVAEDLLSVTDARAEKTTHTTAKKLYLKMRDSAKQNVIEAMPELSRTLEKHMTATPATA